MDEELLCQTLLAFCQRKKRHVVGSPFAKIIFFNFLLFFRFSSVLVKCFFRCLVVLYRLHIYIYIYIVELSVYSLLPIDIYIQSFFNVLSFLQGTWILLDIYCHMVGIYDKVFKLHWPIFSATDFFIIVIFFYYLGSMFFIAKWAWVLIRSRPLLLGV